MRQGCGGDAPGPRPLLTCRMLTVTLHAEYALPRPIDVPSFVAWTVREYDGAAAHVVGERTLICPSQKPMESGRPAGGLTKAHVTTVFTEETVAAIAGVMSVPDAERSGTERAAPQLESTGG